MAKELTAEEREASLSWIDERHEAAGINIEAEAEQDRRRRVEIYDDFCHVETDVRVLHIPQPTLGFLMLYRERRSYFEDDEHGLGRLLVALRRMKEPGYVRALRAGGDIPDEEADDAFRKVHGEDKLEYYIAVEAAAKRAAEETEKKTRKLLELRTGLPSDLMDRLHSSLNLPGTTSTTSSTESLSEPSETS